MSDKKLGLIYMCTSPEGKNYIGQHNSCNLLERKGTHLYRYTDFLKKKCILELKQKFNSEEKRTNPKGFCTALYCAFQKYGFYNFTWKVLQNNIDVNDLDSTEDHLITQYNTMAPMGYNLKLNKSRPGIKKYSEETTSRRIESFKLHMSNNIHKFRTNHEELKDLPQFVTFFRHGEQRGYRIHNHPKCKNRQFASKTVPIEELKKKVIDFLKACETDVYITDVKKKRDNGIPKGIIEQKSNRFLVQFSYQKVRYTKFFSESPRELALNNAIEWMQNKKHSLKNKVEGSETK